MMLLWASAGVPLGIYNILSNKSIALQIQPQILTSLSIITWSQCMIYGHVGSVFDWLRCKYLIKNLVLQHWTWIKAAGVGMAIGGFAAMVELAVVLGLKVSSLFLYQLAFIKHD